MPLNSSFLAGQCKDIWSKKINFGPQSYSTIWSDCYAQVKSNKCMQRAHAVTICLKYNMHVKACPKRMFRSWQLPDHRSQKSAIHSQANQASTARMWSFCMSLQLVWGFPPPQNHYKSDRHTWTPTGRTGTGPPLRPSVALSAFKPQTLLFPHVLLRPTALQNSPTSFKRMVACTSL